MIIVLLLFSNFLEIRPMKIYFVVSGVDGNERRASWPSSPSLPDGSGEEISRTFDQLAKSSRDGTQNAHTTLAGGIGKSRIHCKSETLKS